MNHKLSFLHIFSGLEIQSYSSNINQRTDFVSTAIRAKIKEAIRRVQGEDLSDMQFRVRISIEPIDKGDSHGG